MLDKDAILGQTADLGLQEVSVPEWGGTVCVRGLRGVERDAFEASMWEGDGKAKKQNLANLRARLLVRCLCNADGARLFADDDAAELGLRSGKAIDRLYDVACRLSGIGAAEIETAVKN